MKTLRINKIDLDSFINQLIDIYDNGADFIDLIAKQDGEIQLLSILVREEYLSTEESSETPITFSSIQEDDINDLI